MNNKMYFFFAIIFVAGLVLGSFGMSGIDRFHYFKITVNAMLLAKEADFYECGERATDAYYKSGSRAVAIYGLSEYLQMLERKARLANDPLDDKKSIASTMVLEHGRLAKLYTEIGQTNLSAEHIAKALDCSKLTRRTLTNDVELASFVNSLDELGYKSRYKTNMPPTLFE